MAELARITLVAMARSGEVLIVRDASGQTWLYQPEGAGGSGRIDEETIEWAMRSLGLVSVMASFNSWEELDDYRQRRASEATPSVLTDPRNFDLADVQRLRVVAERWADAGRGVDARRLVLRLLHVPAVLTDPKTHDDLVRLVERLDTLTLPSMPKSPNGRKAAARERWRAILPAA